MKKPGVIYNVGNIIKETEFQNENNCQKIHLKVIQFLEKTDGKDWFRSHDKTLINH